MHPIQLGISDHSMHVHYMLHKLVLSFTLSNYIVIHGVRKAIFDALYNCSKEEWDKAELVVYATLYPDNIDAQMICEMGIKEVVYLANEYKEYTFAKASKKILENVKYRYVYIAKFNVGYLHLILISPSIQANQIRRATINVYCTCSIIPHNIIKLSV